MLTTRDIESKEFGKSVNGYKRDEVDNFLNLIMVDYENLTKENLRLTNENSKLNRDIEVCKKNEATVIDTLNSAKKLMNDISASAEKRAELLVKNAEVEALATTKEARDSVIKLTEEVEVLKSKIKKYKNEYRELLTKELARIDDKQLDLLDEIERDFLPASLEENSEEDFFRGLGNSKKTRVI
ncbi:MAG: DivIVA domain-containing protein [Anaerovoracaceae bacterium]|nr:DivIVA domain-containing protein [Anaerovoracaceae bacterium]